MAPQPPYVLLFQEVEPGAPLAVQVDGRGAIPIFDSETKARAFLSSTDFDAGWEPAELSVNGLLRVLDRYRGQVGYVALDPPPATESGVKIEMGSIEELVAALEQSRQENDLFGLGGFGS